MAFNIEFKRTFNHRPWRDRKDRVKADGPDGFNVRFRALEEDLDTLRDRFVQVNKALNDLAARGATVITVPPFFVPEKGGGGWELSSLGEAHGPSPAPSNYYIEGMLHVPMPAAGQVESLYVSGSVTGTASVEVLFYGGGQQLAKITATRPPGPDPDGFGITAPIPFVPINPKTPYYLVAIGRGGTGTGGVGIRTLQITCKLP